MRAVVFMGDRELAFMDFEDPSPGPGEVVIEMKASGMCGSDLKFYRAPKGGGTAALGLGDKSTARSSPDTSFLRHRRRDRRGRLASGQIQVGQRVMVHHYKGCGHCKCTAASAGSSSAGKASWSTAPPDTARMRNTW